MKVRLTHCKLCQKPITSSGYEFCSRSCANSFNNIGKNRHSIPTKHQPTCEMCGTKVSAGVTRCRSHSIRPPRTRRDKIINNGYYYIMVEGHPAGLKRHGYVGEHVLIIEKNIGRYLEEGEVVHHIDENPLNNNIENLLLLTKADHMRLHSQSRISEWTVFVCDMCGCEYIVDNRHLKFRQNNKSHCCSKSCSVRFNKRKV